MLAYLLTAHKGRGSMGSGKKTTGALAQKRAEGTSSFGRRTKVDSRHRHTAGLVQKEDPLEEKEASVPPLKRRRTFGKTLAEVEAKAKRTRDVVLRGTQEQLSAIPIW